MIFRIWWATKAHLIDASPSVTNPQRMRRLHGIGKSSARFGSKAGTKEWRPRVEAGLLRQR